MRSLKRNPRPKVANGNLKQPKNYKDFLPDLKVNFGNYCCYCEVHCRSVDIEHVAPKSLEPMHACDWDNLLLACPKCNRDYKKNRNASRANYVWPDTSDTFSKYEYHADGSMTANSGDVDAQNTIDLMHLNPVNETNDELCIMRREQWQIATDFLKDYEHEKLGIDRIVRNVKANGYWSVWMTVFKAHPEVTQKIADAFPGTLPKYCTPQ